MSSSRLNSPPPGESIRAVQEALDMTRSTEHEENMSRWIAPGGRLRIGSTGSPIKFAERKRTIRPTSMAMSLSGSSKMFRGPVNENDAQFSDRTVSSAVADIPPSIQTLSSKETEGTIVFSAIDEDKAISHRLSLLEALVGEEVVRSLGLKDLFVQATRPTNLATTQKVFSSVSKPDISSPSMTMPNQYGIQFLRLDESKLPIHKFSDDQADPFPNIYNDIQKALEEGVFVTGVSPLYTANGWEWSPVNVISCEVNLDDLNSSAAAEDDKSPSNLIFRVQFADPAAKGRIKQVYRLDICFDDEDRASFAYRVALALLSREKSKSGIRLQHLIDSLQLPVCANPYPISDTWLARIYEKSVAFKAGWSSHNTKKVLNAADALLPDIEEVQDPNMLSITAEIKEKEPIQRVFYGRKRPSLAEKVLAKATAAANAAPEAILSSSDDEEDFLGRRKRTVDKNINPATGLSIRATPAELLALASSNPQEAALFAEVVFEYEFHGKLATVIEVLRRAESACKLALLNNTPIENMRLASTIGLRASAELEAFSQVLSDRYTKLRLPDLPTPSAPPALGKLDVGYYPDPYSGAAIYEEARNNVANGVSVASDAAIKILVAVMSMWMLPGGLGGSVGNFFLANPNGTNSFSAMGVMSDVTFLDDALTALSLPCTVKNYVKRQSDHVRTLSERLKHAWPRDITHVLMDGLPHGEGFNIYEQNITNYRGSPMEKLIKRIEAQLVTCLRDIILRSCTTFVNFLARFLPHPVHDVVCDDGIYRTSRAPLFEVALVIRGANERERRERMEAKRETNGALRRTFGPPNAKEQILSILPGLGIPELFEPLVDENPESEEPTESAYVTISPSRLEVQRAILGSLDAMQGCIKGIPGIERRALTLLNFPGDEPLLLPLGTGNPLCRDMDLTIATAKACALRLLNGSLMNGCKTLCKKFQKIAWLAQAHPTTDVVKAVLDRAIAVALEKIKQEEAEHAKLVAKAATEKVTDNEGKVKPAPVPEPKLHLVPGAPDIPTLFEEIQKFHDAMEYASTAALAKENVGLLLVHTDTLRESLVSRALDCRDALLRAVLEATRSEGKAVDQAFREMIKNLAVTPSDEKQLVQARQYIVQCETTVRGLDVVIENLHDRLESCQTFSFNPLPEDFKALWDLRKRPLDFQERVQDCLHAWGIVKTHLVATLEKEKAAFERIIERLEADVNAFRDEGSNAIAQTGGSMTTGAIIESILDSTVLLANNLESRINQALQGAEDINEREQALGFPVTPYPIMKTISDTFEPFQRLWVSLQEFISKRNAWNKSSILELDANEIEREVTDWWTMSYRAMRSMGEAYPGAYAVAQQLRTLTDAYRTYIPLIKCLASPALEVRHWNALSDKLDVFLNPIEEEVLLETLLESGMLSRVEEVEEITVQAEKEHALKKALDAMKSEWSTIAFDIVPYKNSGTYIIRGTDEIHQLLDDQIVKTQTMMGSPYIRPNAEECEKWDKLLSTVQLTLEAWLSVQRTWLYLEPIFSSEDIMRQMPQEGRRFASVDKLFRATMITALEERRVLHAAGRDAMLEKLREANKALDLIQKGLNDYLELKRLAFPRFFFLSNDELLEILSQTKDPRAAQPHLGKCFEGVNRIAFRGEKDGELIDPNDLTITNIISTEGESVPLVQLIDPNDPKSKGNVEVWFNDLQKSMRLTVKDIIKQAMAAYPQTPRKDWVLSWPGQIVLCVSQLYWTREVEEAINSDGVAGLERYERQLNDQLQDIVTLVRSNLSRMGRITLGALTVIDVHARDVVTEIKQKGVNKITDFDWMAQLRYSWDHHPDGEYNRYGEDPYNMVAKIVNTAQLYGYEYLGNSSRLVITPLTDRCYRTLMSAVYLNYGGAPAGPAGTGKTETTKDLAKAMAIQCVVFNCSDGLDYLAMGKFFKGLAASGAWACFDEFNRIELEVLSVVAQQVLTVQKAKQARVTRFNFEGTILPLNPDANAFITMNPGYAGRSELPDNLKALFRPVAMMVPDYALISEIKLYSVGFADARNMARKLTQVLRLSSEQLSSQKHYDYGMRAVFSILVRAGNLRQLLGNDPAWSEEKIVLSAINDVNIPKFTSNDLPLFKGITSDLFPGVTLPEPDYTTLMAAIKDVCKQDNLQTKDEFLQSIIQLYETVAVRHGLMLVGQTGCGKTSVLNTLAKAMTSLAGKDEFVPVHVHTMNPKSITQGQLYGNFDENTHEWTDGVLAVTYRECTRDESTDRHWVMFDGPVDAVWIENMNTVLDDNKKLCLNSGEIIKMTGSMTMMFETDSLAEASPATVSRCGMVYMEPRRLGWRPLVQSWMKTLPRVLANSPATISYMHSLFEWLVPPTVFFCSTAINLLTPMTELHMVASFLSLYSCLLEKPFGKRVVTSPLDATGLSPTNDEDAKVEAAQLEKNPDTPKPNDTPKVLEGCFIMAAIWSIGGVTDAEGMQAFSDFFRTLTSGNAAQHPVFQDFMLKVPKYDAHYVGGGLALQAEEGDVRDHDDLSEDEKNAVMANRKKKNGGAGSKSPKASAPVLDESDSLQGLEESMQLSETIEGTEDFAESSSVDVLIKETVSRFKVKPMTEGELKTVSTAIPDTDSVYDYVFHVEKGRGTWKSWMDGVPAYRVPDDTEYKSVIVPTMNTIRYTWLLDLLIHAGKHVLCVGETGTGKSVTLRDMLLNRLSKDTFTPLFLNFSAQTSANQTQEIIDGRVNRRRRGLYGPPLGQTMIVFVDDLNMPAKEKYGAQPPIELLRQWMDHRGWYDYKDKDVPFMEIADTQFVAAMGPPGGGRTFITQRYLRHFNLLGFVPLDDKSLQRVFTTIVSWSVRNATSTVKGAVQNVVSATIALYNAISKELRPTPAKSHYTFNLRDLSKVFQGMHQTSEKKLPDATRYYRLWAHECLRVFQDRLVSDEDRQWFQQCLEGTVQEHLRTSWKDIKGDHDVLLYGNFVDRKDGIYEELSNREELYNVMVNYLEDYNATASIPLNLVLFGYAIEHVARISRIINQPGGNALLVGVGGSGRKSLCTLAAFMAGYSVFSVEISKAYGMNEWRDDLKTVIQMAGRERKNTVFLFSDTQIMREAFIEDISNILNNGEVPNLFAPDERAAIIGDVQMSAKKQGKNLVSAMETWAYFIEQVKANLHIVLCFSPIGDAFRTRLRMFPSLVNCTTIDWFQPWPEEGLRSVAQAKLQGAEIPGSDPEALLDGIIEVCCSMQTKVTALSNRFRAEMRRHYYVTPTSYLELLATFTSLLSSKRAEILASKNRYESGMQKIISTEAMVDVMQKELVELQPQLVKASEETDVMIKRIQVFSAEVNANAKVVEAEEVVCSQQAEAAAALASECQIQLAEAEPMLERAVAAVKALSKPSITEVQAMKKPPDGVKLTMEAVCVMLGYDPEMVPNPSGRGPRVPDYWPVAQSKVLGDSKLLEKLSNYFKGETADDILTIPDSILTKIKPYLERPDFDPVQIQRSSVAAKSLCIWVRAAVDYDKSVRIVAPKRKALADAQEALRSAQNELKEKQNALAELRGQLLNLEQELQEATEKKLKLEQEVSNCAARLDRAQRLIGGLGGEKSRWSTIASELQATLDGIVGDLLLASGMISYLGAFPANYREDCVKHWSELMREQNIPFSDDFSLAGCLGDPVQIRTWTIDRLPNDSFSIDNAIMLYNSSRWPLCIDPQGQANRWIRNTEAQRSLKIVKQSQPKFVQVIESAIQFGSPVLLEGVSEVLDPVLEPLLARQIIRVGGINNIKIGENLVPIDPNFRLYITTVLPNPHYPPETCVKVNLLNFMATMEGLGDQMLGIVVRMERPDLEEQRERLILEDAENKRQLKVLEDKILHLLTSSSGNILDDEQLISALGESKVTSDMILKQVDVAARTQTKIAAARAGYVPVAKLVSALFFCVADLASIDPMYQYSLEWYIRLFLLSFDRCPKPEPQLSTAGGSAAVALLEKRLAVLKDAFTMVLYENICRSLFEKDKVLFSFLLTTKIMITEKRLTQQELTFFLQGSISMNVRKPKPEALSFLSDRGWADILDLRTVPNPAFANIEAKIEAAADVFREISHSSQPMDLVRSFIQNDPDLSAGNVSYFQQLCILRCVRMDRIISEISNFICAEVGQTFIDPPPFDLQKCYEDSNPVTPLIFVLSTGADPMTDLMKLAERRGANKKLVSVSLGQGQGPVAEGHMNACLESGGWVVLQNCHLAESWLPTMERLIEEMSLESAHPEFRLWLTAMPSPKFPVSVLQNGVKITMEPPKGLRANMIGSFASLEKDWFEVSNRPAIFKTLVFGLCYFHALVLERRKFGALGWNIRYDFADSDLRISLEQLKLFVDDPAYAGDDGNQIPFDALKYLTGECNYGGRVTDDMDRRVLMNLLADVYNYSVVDSDPDKAVRIGGCDLSPASSLDVYGEFIRGMPLQQPPVTFGLHDNADISCAIQEAVTLLSSVASIQPRGSAANNESKEEKGNAEEKEQEKKKSSKSNADDALLTLARDILGKLPELFDIEAISVKFPVSFSESLNTVLVQECMRYNALLSVVRTSLRDIDLAIRGLSLMSQDLENLASALVQGKVSALWSAVSYPSVKPLGAWVTDLVKRLDFLRQWIDVGKKPDSFWISGFFFTQSFLTGVRQNYARKHHIPIDELTFDYHVLNQEQCKLPHGGGPPEDGVYVYGLFIQGASWDAENGVLQESRPRELFAPLSYMHMLPCKTVDLEKKVRHVYDCPVYKTTERAGVLSTTGHSTNFIMLCALSMQKAHTQQHWIKRGVALFAQSDD